MMLLVTAYSLTGHADLAWFLAGTIFLLVVPLLVGGLLALIRHILKGIPTFYIWVLICTVLAVALLALTATSVSIGVVAASLSLLAVASLLGANVAELAGDGWHKATHMRRIIILGGLVLGLVGLTAGGVWLLDAGAPLTFPPQATAQAKMQIEPMAMADPSQPGPYSVCTLFYGSGEDLHRPEYGVGVDLTTKPVDGSAMIEGWSSLRTAYWGFGPEALPLNGRVWYPEGQGPFPLVVIVHGQHPMEDDSDPGYAYLGELLASRGFVVASVDENFLNLSPLIDLLILSSLEEENDLRGWLLLEHLQQWREWNADARTPFYQKVDLDSIALVGHSRGGEAIVIAAAFNRLPYYPDDATVRFDYGFGIRSLLAFAPVDGQYKPTGRGTPLENVNYLVLHGAHDMDVFTFEGAGQYERVRFDEEAEWFKAGLYIYGANHGQFNTCWGRKDLFEPVMRVFNLEQLMPAEEQRQIAKVYASAFLEATLHGESGYRPLFRDYRRGRAWLPDTIYLNQYQDAGTQWVSTYEEDINPGTTTLPGGRLKGENLVVWREQLVTGKWGNTGDQAVYLGWDVDASGGTSSYTIELPEPGLALTRDSTLVFALADAHEDPFPESDSEKNKATEPVDLTLEVVDCAGQVARLPLSHNLPLQRQLEGRLGKAAFMSPFPQSEVVYQHSEYPLADFCVANPAFDPANLTAIRFVFDRIPKGVVVLDDVGFFD
jgi:dienelactone hydrolase